MNRFIFAPAVALLFACGGEQGTHPHDASVAQHNEMAQKSDQAAEAHASGEAPSPGPTTCGRGGCWTSVQSPSELHKKDAERYRDLAAKHRAASASLVEAEKSACAGISDYDRDVSPFYHREDITSVSTIQQPVQSSKPMGTKTVGAKVEFRALQGMTAEWLQRVVDCHLARAASMGHNMPEMDFCPLELKDVKASVSSTGNGFAINVTSDDQATVQEIIKRTQALKAQ